MPTHPTARVKARGPEHVPLPFTCEMGTATLPPPWAAVGGTQGLASWGEAGEPLSEGVHGLLSNCPHRDQPRCVRERQTQEGSHQQPASPGCARSVLASGFSPRHPRGCNPELITQLSQKQPCAVCWGGGTDGPGEGISQGDRSIRQSAFPKLPGGGSPVCHPLPPVQEDTESPLRGYKGGRQPGVAHGAGRSPDYSTSPAWKALSSPFHPLQLSAPT